VATEQDLGDLDPELDEQQDTAQDTMYLAMQTLDTVEDSVEDGDVVSDEDSGDVVEVFWEEEHILIQHHTTPKYIQNLAKRMKKLTSKM
jgi:predicted Zn-dependent protease